MNKRFVKSTVWLVIITLIFPLLTACGQLDLSDTYPLESVARDGNSTSYVYRAENTTVPAAAAAIAEKRSPKEMSKEDTERMFLVYSDEMIQVMQDPEAPEDSLIEVDSLEYVSRNYDYSFLQMYLSAQLLNSVFDGMSKVGKGAYRGYTDRNVYKPAKTYKTPTKEDYKKAPPITVDKKGSVTRRDTNKDTTVGSGGKITERTPSSTSKGSIKRDQSGGNFNSKKPTVKKSKPPKTSVGKGSVKRRR
ncbi:DUF4247 domain-containing protein [Paenibacillus marinisediminis]